jgi:hypothetical protein
LVPKPPALPEDVDLRPGKPGKTKRSACLTETRIFLNQQSNLPDPDHAFFYNGSPTSNQLRIPSAQAIPIAPIDFTDAAIAAYWLEGSARLCRDVSDGLGPFARQADIMGIASAAVCVAVDDE